MEPMKTKKNRSLCSGPNNVGQCEIRPGGMLVQKRNSDPNNNINNSTNSKPIPTIRVRVKYGSSYHHINISSLATFGELKKKLAESTGLHVEDQKLVFKDKERDSKAFLDISRVKDGSKIVLVEDVASRERRCVEMRRIASVEKAAKSMAQINLEVDKLQGKVKDLETNASKGGKIATVDVDNLIEMLMSKLIQLDGIVAEGDLKLQRRMLVRRVQKYIETLDVLKLQIVAKPKTMEPKIIVHDQHRREISIGDNKPRPLNQENCAVKKPILQRPVMKHFESVVVVTKKWETFD